MKITNKLKFWTNVSNYSIVLCGVMLVLKMYFRKYIEWLIIPILAIGVFSFLVFLLSEIVKHNNRRKNENN
jgi:hypothetical protein